jgi:hypothetical protein
VSVVFRMEAPKGWRFVTGTWPEGMAHHVSPEGDVLEMDSATVASSYATTMGRLNTLSFEKVAQHSDNGFIPGYGALLAVASTALIALIVTTRIQRTSRD